MVALTTSPFKLPEGAPALALQARYQVLTDKLGVAKGHLESSVLVGDGILFPSGRVYRVLVTEDSAGRPLGGAAKVQPIDPETGSGLAAPTPLSAVEEARHEGILVHAPGGSLEDLKLWDSRLEVDEEEMLSQMKLLEASRNALLISHPKAFAPLGLREWLTWGSRREAALREETRMEANRLSFEYELWRSMYQKTQESRRALVAARSALAKTTPRTLPSL
jgi:hypothetical protein